MADQVLAKLAIQIAANTAQFNSSLKQSQNQFSGFVKGIQGAATGLGVALGGAALFRGLQEAQTIAASFEHTMQEVKAITGATGREFQKLESDAKKLGASTKFTSNEVGQLQVAYGRLGFTTQEILDATAATLDLAAATGEDLAKSADVAGSTVRGFGLQANETQRVVDVMAASFNKTALGLDNFTESMKYVAPIAAAAGASVEETTALLGVLADAGIRGSTAGTSLRKIFTDLAKDGRPLRDRLQELANKGISLTDAFDEVGRTAQTSLLILSKNTEKSDELARSFTNVAGEAKKMALIMGDDLLGDVDKLTSAFEGLFIKLSQSDAFRHVTQGLTSIVNFISGTGASLDDRLDFIARALTFDPSQSRIQKIIEELSQLRQELGKDIETPQIDFLIEKYELTEKQAQQLKSIITEVNEAIGFQETVLKNVNFINQQRGYNDLTKAAQTYIDELNALILLETNRKEAVKQEGIETGKQFDTSGFDRLIDQYLRIRDAVEVYRKSLLETGSVAASTVVAQIETLATLEADLKRLKDELENIPTFNIPGLQAKTKEIEALALKIERIQNAIAGIRPEQFGAGTILSNQAVNVQGDQVLRDTSTDKEILSSINNKGIGETAFSIPEVNTDALIASLKKAEDNINGFVSRMEEQFIYFSGIVTNALSGIGQAMGAAISGSANLGQALLSVLGSVLVQLGEMILAAGIGVEAFKASLESLQGPVAIAAGLALIALGTAISSSISNLGANPTGGGGSSNITPVQRGSFSVDLNLGGEFTIKQGQLSLVLANENIKSQRLGNG
jgi:DNA-binding ferritin-like protein (Dps family)